GAYGVGPVRSVMTPPVPLPGGDAIVPVSPPPAASVAPFPSRIRPLFVPPLIFKTLFSQRILASVVNAADPQVVPTLMPLSPSAPGWEANQLPSSRPHMTVAPGGALT